MLLAVDAGNSNIVLGVADGDNWEGVWRMETRSGKQAENFAEKTGRLLRSREVDIREIKKIVVSSVVPQVTPEVRRSLAEMTGREPIVVSWKTDTGIQLGTDAPEEVGTDLIANAVAAYDMFGDHCIVVDFGTATTLMLVEKPGVLKGGAICGGLKVSARALAGEAAQLPDIPLDTPGKVISGNTLGAMQAGVVLGHICMVEGLLEKMKKETGGKKIMTVATGGLAEMLSRHTEVFDRVEPMLTLNGLRLIGEKV